MHQPRRSGSPTPAPDEIDFYGLECMGITGIVGQDSASDDGAMKLGLGDRRGRRCNVKADGRRAWGFLGSPLYKELPGAADSVRRLPGVWIVTSGYLLARYSLSTLRPSCDTLMPSLSATCWAF